MLAPYKNAHTILVKGRDHLERPKRRWRIILAWILHEWGVNFWAKSMWFWTGSREELL